MTPPHPLPTPPRPAWNTNRNLVVTHPLLSLLESCASFRRLLQLQALLTVSGLAAHRFPASRLLAFCALSDPPRLAHAEAILAGFTSPPGPNAYMLATMMRAYLRADIPRRALALFRRVLRDHLPADARTLVFAVKAADASSSPGGAVHCVALKRGFLGQSVLVGNALIHLYASDAQLPDARKMMVVAEGVWPNRVTLVAAASAVGQMRLPGLGRTLHRCVADSGVNRTVNSDNVLVDMFGKCGCMASAKEVFDRMAVKDVYSWTSMVGAYVKCGDLENAARIFEDMPTRNAVSWSCMIAGYSQANQPEEAVRMFNAMLAAGEEPIDATLVSVLSACAQLGFLDLGRWIYDKYIASNKVGLTVNLGNAFIDMFAKCGDVDGAASLFGDMEERNLVTWNSMIMAHAAHGQSAEALYLFEQFEGTGIVPDEITYTGVLSACSHSGFVSDGRYHFKEMKMVYGIEPRFVPCGTDCDALNEL
ncbi:hypothetical protein QOZ80_5AG0386220 [Eleusine coracana subsp. coracana]|nr:hypothetical protein QOZ80_5AG0386220 [Eleusine coracana subsp. coracana]